MDNFGIKRGKTTHGKSEAFAVRCLSATLFALLATFFFLLTANISYANVLNWSASDWTAYDTVIIDSTQVSDDLTDFPVYVDLSDLSAAFWSTTPSGASLVGTDIRVTNNSNTELPRELVFASSTAQTGELHFKADSISSTTDTTFKIWYNGTTTGDYATTTTYGAQNVWTNDYFAVWHMQDDPTGTVYDSTSNSRNATEGSGVAMTSSDLVDGAIGKAINFDGFDDVLVVPSFTPHLTSLSIEGWLRPTGIGPSSGFYSVTDFLGSTYFGLRGSTDTFSMGSFWNPSWNTWNAETNDVTDNEFQYAYAGISDITSTAEDVVMSKNGASLAVTDQSPTLTFSQPGTEGYSDFLIGSGDSFDPFSGDIDELRISSTTRSTAWQSAQHINQATTTDFYTAAEFVGVTGSSTISNSDATQTNNAFSFRNETNEPLFTFKITPNSGNATVTNTVISLLGVDNLDTTDFSNIRLYADDDNDGLYDVGDTVLDGTGVMSIDGQSGSLTFDADFLVTTATNYVVIADWNAPEKGTFVTFDLFTSGLTVIDSNGTQNVYGGVSSVQHHRNNRGGLGGGSSQIGGAAPSGDSEEVGGGSSGLGAVDTNTGGSTIGSEVDFFWPTGTGAGTWTNAAFAYDRTNGTYANTTTGSAQQIYTSFNDSVPSGDTVEGVEVKMEISGTTAAGTIDVELSWDGGSSWTSSKSSGTLSDTDTVVTLGGASDDWGQAWTPAQISNFALRVTANPSSNEVRIDGLQAKIYHQASGGGSGGLGAI